MRALRYAVVFVAAFVAGMAGALPGYGMVLSVPMSVVWPLTLLTVSLLATLSAGWVANLASLGSASEASARTRSRLLAIFGVSLLGAVVALLLLFAEDWVLNTFGLGFGPGATLLLYLPGLVVFLGATTAAACRLRGPGGRLGWSGSGALALSPGVLILSLLTSPALGLVPANYGVLVGTSLAVVAISSLLAIAWLSRRGVFSGRELARDAAITLCLLAVIVPVLSGTLYITCSTLGCGP